jgi:hypothetical protein
VRPGDTELSIAVQHFGEATGERSEHRLAVAMRLYLEAIGILRQGQLLSALTGQTVDLGTLGAFASFFRMLDCKGDLPDGEAGAQSARIRRCADAITQVPDARSRAALSSGKGAAVALRASRSGAARTSLPSERNAQARIRALLPRIAEAVALVDGGRRTINDAICDTAAGLTLGKLRELGFDARLIDANGHVTVRVRTSGAELIVDPTLMQFFEDGSPIDRALGESGGFVGTEAALEALLAEHMTDWLFDDPAVAASLRQPRSSSDRAVLVDDQVDVLMALRFKGGTSQTLRSAAVGRAQRYAAFIRGKISAVAHDDERKAFMHLREGP